MLKTWHINSVDNLSADRLKKQYNISGFLTKLLLSRGYSDFETEQILQPSSSFDNQQDFADIEAAVLRIENAIESGERVCVYGDYDADGVTSTALLVLHLENMGCDVTYYIPSRYEHGYGLQRKAIDEIAEDDVTLIVTVDNGITSIDEVEYATTLGIDVVITDHHLPGDTIPDAVAVVDPHRVDCPSKFKDLAGVGVAFSLVVALEGGEISEMLDLYAPLVALGTIADMMPLVSDNRLFVTYGLSRIADGDNIGITSLVNACGHNVETLTSTDISFGAVPCINAAGRLGDASVALELLLCECESRADEVANALVTLNSQRKQLESELMAEINKTLCDNPDFLNQDIIVLAGDNWHKGILGIAAAKIMQRYQKPCVLISIQQDGTGVGSARSMEGFSLYNAVLNCSDLLIKFGGHEQAAGITIATENIADFRDKINEYYSECYDSIVPPTLNVDLQINFSDITADNVIEMRRLQPHGVANPEPTFCIRCCKIMTIYSVSDGKYARFRLQSDSSVFYAISFGLSFDDIPFAEGDFVDIVATLDINETYSKSRINVKIVDIRPSSFDEKKYFCDIRNFYYAANGFFDKISTEHSPPTREQVAIVYKHVAKRKSVLYDLELLYYALHGSGVSYYLLLVSVAVLLELSLFEIIYKDGKIYLGISPSAQKTDLDSSELMTNLKKVAIRV